MNWLRDLPVKRKLTLVILATCSSVLLLACVALAAFELFDFRRTIAGDMTVLADVLGKNTQAALAFQDQGSARGTLQALQAEPKVVSASVYDEAGNRFAAYTRGQTEGEFPPSPGSDGYRFDGGYLRLFRPVVLNEKRIGTIYVQAELGGMYERLRLFGGIAALVLFGSLLVAFALSSRLQRPISGPILALAETAKIIAERKDFSVRAVKDGHDEVGVLTDGFNQMLAAIDEREGALRAANQALQAEIGERRRAEGKVTFQLARLELLHQITCAIGERQDLPSIFQVVVGSLEDHLPIDFSCVCLYDPARHLLTVTCLGRKSGVLAADLSLTEQSQIAVDENNLSRSVQGQWVYEPEVGHIESAFQQRLAQAGLHSLVVAPLVVESTVFGVLIAARRQAHGFSSAECEFLRQLSGHVALAAHQSQLYGALQQAYDDLRQTQQAVMQQERLRALGQMASGIAHDINNAISPVALYTESLLEKEPNLSPRTRDYLVTIQRSVEDVEQTVSRMREFYRQREPQLTLTTVDVNRLVEQVVDLTRARWSDMPQERGMVIELHKSLSSPLPTILGVESEIREALINLIFNAVDAMPEGGTLTLRTSTLESRPRAAGEVDHLPRVAVEVIDNGVGMDEQTRRRCLEPFFTTKGERGTGLGLAMVYGIVQRHGADIEIESTVKHGTTVRLTFATPVAGADEQVPYVGSALPPRLRLLVVDDDPLLTRSLRDTLEADGHDVHVAGGGREGIEAFHSACKENRPFGVVITDLGMPHVDGRKVAEAVKTISPSTPVILLTGWGQRLVAEGDVPPHVDFVLSKPPKLRELRDTLAHCCSVPAAPLAESA